MPLYEQVASILRGRIAAGEWSRGPLPSNRALQETYDVGEYVVTHAIRLLEDEGLVFTVPRRGTYVRQQGLALDNPHVVTVRPDSNRGALETIPVRPCPLQSANASERVALLGSNYRGTMRPIDIY